VSEFNKDLPSTWLKTILDQIALIEMGQSPESKFYNDNGQGLPFYQGKAEFGERYPKVRKWCSNPNKIAEAGDILVSIRAPVGPTNIVQARSCIGRGLATVRAITPINQLFLFYFFRHIETWLSDQGTGSTFAAISGQFLRQIEFVLPPIGEQIRIVEKLEELLSDLDAGVAELKAAQKKLVQYRQSLLKAAVEGKLTEQWRNNRYAASPQYLTDQARDATANDTAANTPLSPRGRGVGGEGATTSGLPHNAWLRDRARELRKAQTPQEQALWQQLRAKRFSGFKFRRQQVIGRYIADFVCFEQKLVIELDGSQHSDTKQADAQRDHWLNGQGFRVLRFWNNQWQSQQTGVLEAIWQALHEDKPSPPLPNPSPTRGEGLSVAPMLMRKAEAELNRMRPFALMREGPEKRLKPARNYWNASSRSAAPAGKPSNSPSSRSKAKPRPKAGKTNTPSRLSRIPAICRNYRRVGFGLQSDNVLK
jgi:very-short-patch-repair endonuclease